MNDTDAGHLNGSPGQRAYIWGEKDIISAKKTLKLKFPDALADLDSIQEMIDELSAKYRYDPKQIERAIVQHLKKKKL